jgi:hypothetical protein
MQIGRLYHIVLYLSFVVWLIVIMRGLWPALKQKQTSPPSGLRSRGVARPIIGDPKSRWGGRLARPTLFG